jgi:reverse gyrase
MNYHGVCFYCGGKLMSKKTAKKHPCYALAPTKDHVQPLSRDGLDVPLNKVACCYRCNSQKKNMLIEEFRMFRFEHPFAEFFFEYDIRRRMKTEHLREPEPESVFAARVQNLEVGYEGLDNRTQP